MAHATPITSLDDLNSAPMAAAADWLTSLYAGQAWVGSAGAAQRPFASLAGAKHALAELVRKASPDHQFQLLKAWPQLAMPASGDASEIQSLMASYREKFGHPFLLATGGPRRLGVKGSDILSTIQRRLDNHPDFERAEALRQVHRMIELAIDRQFGLAPALGDRIWDQHETLAQFSDPGFAERGQLTVTYLTDAHRKAAHQLCSEMKKAGFDDARIDAVGNVVGIYNGSAPGAKRLLTGSHYDTVRNAGRYDGRLGILTPLCCVAELARAGRRLPFGIEVVGFSEEEGQRYKATFLGSGALTGDFNPAWLNQKDADGVTLKDAMHQAGLDPAGIPGLKRDAGQYLGFVEIHIEQGPVLNEIDLPLGVVTSINGSVRYVCEMIGMASHAGTTPMDRRRDAAAGVAELALYVERRASRDGTSVATIGMLEVPGGSINVVPGRCRFSLDLRAPTDIQRDALVADVLNELDAICARRGLRHTREETMRAAAAPSHPDWQARWSHAVSALGLPVFAMPSGAGHDAMKLHDIMPQAMLFVRGENAGISHNPLESTTSHDMDLAARAFLHLLDQLAKDWS